MPEYILDSSILRQIEARVEPMQHDFQVLRRGGRLRRCVPDRPALHEDDGLLAIAVNRSGGQPETRVSTML